MKRLFIIIFLSAIAWGGFANTLVDKVAQPIILSEYVIKQIGYDWYGENFQGDCEVTIHFTENETGSYTVGYIESDQESVANYLRKKLSTFSVETAQKEVNTTALKFTFTQR